MNSLLVEDIALLRDTIRANDGDNVATSMFARKVEALISAFYDDIGELTDISLQDILDLFLIKVLYVNRRSRDAETLAYIGRMLERYVLAGELSIGGAANGHYIAYMSDLMEETAHPTGAFQNRFELYKKYGDNSLFISGVFPESFGRKRSGSMMGGSALVDQQYFSTVGPKYYNLAANEDLAEFAKLRTTMLRLARHFDIYVEALNEMSDRYVMGMDMRIIADKMLDAFNRYRESRDPVHLETARKYAALMKLDGKQWPALTELALESY